MRDVGIVTENKISIQFQTKRQAETAVSIAKRILKAIPEEKGFGWRTEELIDLLVADEQEVMLSEECEALPVLDFIDVMKEIIIAIAKELAGSSFTFSLNASDSLFPESYFDGSFDGRALSFEVVVLGDGLGCPFCGEYVMDVDEYEEGEAYSCPSCGKVLDFYEAVENDSFIYYTEKRIIG